MKGTLLVRGGAGFIGYHTVDLLLAKGYQVRVLDSLQPRVHPHGKPDYLPSSVEFHHGEVEKSREPADCAPRRRLRLAPCRLSGLHAGYQPVPARERREHGAAVRINSDV